MINKKTICTLISFLLLNNIYSQIGINTENIMSGLLLQIDASGNNSQLGSVYSDDFVVSRTGNVGIGTVSPQTKLHIVGNGTSLKIPDGTQAINRILTSNQYGEGTWQDFIPTFKLGYIGNSIGMISTEDYSNVMAKTNVNIELSPGQWLVFYSIAMTSNSVYVGSSREQRIYRMWIQSALGDDYNDTTSDSITKNRFSTNGYMGKTTVISGWVVIDNQTTSNKKYSVWVGAVQRPLPNLFLSNIGSPSDNLTQISAIRMNLHDTN